MEKSSILGFLHCPRVSSKPPALPAAPLGHRALIAEAQGRPESRRPGWALRLAGRGRCRARSPPHREQLGVSSHPHAGESWLHWRERVPVHASAAVRCQASGRERETFSAVWLRECAARRVPGRLPLPGPRPLLICNFFKQKVGSKLVLQFSWFLILPPKLGDLINVLGN